MQVFDSSGQNNKIILVLDSIQALLIICAVGVLSFDLWGFSQPDLLPVSFAATGIVAFLLVVIRGIGQAVRRSEQDRDAAMKASLVVQFCGPDSSEESMAQQRGRAIKYCEDLIRDYRSVRSRSQVIYYVFQVATIVLSGVTPILVLLDKTDAEFPWLKWLPVIFPAVASIVTSVSTSFPFQENAVAANSAVELLEAELEKFVLAVTSAYRWSDVTSEVDRRAKQQEAVESFIVQVNRIHLKQLQPSEAEAQKKAPEAAEA